MAAKKKKAAPKKTGAGERIVVENVNHPGQKRNVDAAKIAPRGPRS